MDGYWRALQLLPPVLKGPLSAISEPERVQDIHLRSGQAVSVGCGAEEWFVNADGTLSADNAAAITCDDVSLQQTVARVMQYSTYSHREELRYGFVTAEGCRVGIAGTAIVEKGVIVGYRSLRSLCLRVAREHRGCAASLAKILLDGDVHSALICSEPAGGKTGMLRDLVREAARRRLSTAVVDERSEVSGLLPLEGCDVLCGTPKPQGIEQAVRCLSPRIVLLDELGDDAELRAVQDAAVRGVPTIATVHARTTDELRRRASLMFLLKNGVFDYTVLLCGRHAPGMVASVQRTEEWIYGDHRYSTGLDSGHRLRYRGATRAVPPRCYAGNM